MTCFIIDSFTSFNDSSSMFRINDIVRLFHEFVKDRLICEINEKDNDLYKSVNNHQSRINSSSLT
jgi:hypothetical protein